MRVIVGGRQAGKTHTLVEVVRDGWQRADGSWSRVIITSTEREAERLRRDYDLHSLQVISSQSWNTARFGRERPDAVYLDNLEDWLYSQLGQVPEAVTSTQPVEVTHL